MTLPHPVLKVKPRERLHRRVARRVFLLRRGSLPLLARDLREQAARPRTYVIRVSYALLFFAVVFWHVNELFDFLEAGLTVMELGRGREIFDKLVLWQLAGIYLVMPIVTAGAIAHEKERDTLQVLMTTQLPPATVMREKLGSRVFVMFCLVAMSLPMLAFSYSLGGVRPLQFAGSITLLMTTIIQVGAFTLMMSAWCTSTASTFTSTLALGVPVLGLTALGVVPSIISSSFPGVWILVAVIQVVTARAFLFFGQQSLVSRLAVPNRNVVLELFHGVDLFFRELNDRLARGKTVFDDRLILPENDPIAWRGLYRKSLGTPRYVVRILMALGLPVSFTCWFGYLQAGHDYPAHITMFSATLAILWLITVPLLCSAVAGLVAAERTQQTLNVILVSPLEGADILQQYLRGLRRLLYVLAVPFAMIYCSRYLSYTSSPNEIIRLIGSFLTLGLFVPLSVWIGMLIGLRVATQLRALVQSVTVLLVWSVLPAILFAGPVNDPWLESLLALSPGVFLIRLEAATIDPVALTPAACFYGLLLVAVRNYSLSHADRYLDRCSSVTETSLTGPSVS